MKYQILIVTLDFKQVVGYYETKILLFIIRLLFLTQNSLSELLEHPQLDSEHTQS